MNDIDSVGVRPAPRVLACCRGMVIYGGLERMCLAAMGAIVERGGVGHCVFTPMTEPTVIQAARRIGATWSIAPARRAMRRGLSGAMTNSIDAIRNSARLLADAIRFRPTHVFVPEFGLVLDQWFALLLLRVLRRRIILALQNAPASTPFYARLWRWIVDPAVETYVCASDSSRRTLTRVGIPDHKIRVVYNTAASLPDTATLEAPRALNRVIYVGQIIPAKGLDLLLEAIGLLVARGRDVSLDVVGQHQGWIAPAYEGFRSRLFDRVAQADLAGRVRFLGFRDDVPRLMASAAVHCIPSRPEMYEGLPIVVVEAKHAGIPSIAFDHGPFPELIEHTKTGWLCRRQDAESLAEGLDYYLTAPELLVRAERPIRASASRFDREQFKQGWTSAFAIS